MEPSAIKIAMIMKKTDDSLSMEESEFEFRHLKWNIRLNQNCGIAMTFRNENSSLVRSFFYFEVHIKIISPETNEILHQEPTVELMISNRYFGTKCDVQMKYPIEWNKLLEIGNAYSVNDECIIEFEIDAGPTQTYGQNKWVEMVKIQQCCKDSEKGKFRFIIKKPMKFIALVSNPFVLRGIEWIISFMKQKNEFKFRIFRTNICNNEIDNDNNLPYQMITNTRLMSFNANSNPIESRAEHLYETTVHKAYELFSLDWKEFSKAENQYIKNGTFIVEIDICLKKSNEISAKTKAKTEPIQLECSICFENIINRPISSTLCGHIFCTVCIEQALQNKAVCPQCEQVTSLQQIHEIYLPLR